MLLIKNFINLHELYIKILIKLRNKSFINCPKIKCCFRYKLNYFFNFNLKALLSKKKQKNGKNKIRTGFGFYII